MAKLEALAAAGPFIGITIYRSDRMCLKISVPYLESLYGNCQSFPGEWCRKLQTHRMPGWHCTPARQPDARVPRSAMGDDNGGLVSAQLPKVLARGGKAVFIRPCVFHS